MEARIAKLEVLGEYMARDIAEIKVEQRSMRADFIAEHRRLREIMATDFRLLFGALVTVALGMAGLLAKAFHWL
jgi:hypothetical protein